MIVADVKGSPPQLLSRALCIEVFVLEMLEPGISVYFILCLRWRYRPVGFIVLLRVAVVGTWCLLAAAGRGLLVGSSERDSRPFSLRCKVSQSGRNIVLHERSEIPHRVFKAEARAGALDVYYLVARILLHSATRSLLQRRHLEWRSRSQRWHQTMRRWKGQAGSQCGQASKCLDIFTVTI
jgi:hypothetical protein